MHAGDNTIEVNNSVIHSTLRAANLRDVCKTINETISGIGSITHTSSRAQESILFGFCNNSNFN